ncbi:MAG: AAA family ATPase, partial [Chloroflexota bacterium]
MQKIIIKNFMALQDVEIEIHKFLILIGEQASGKSAVSKLIYFFREIRRELMDIFFDEIYNTPEKELNIVNQLSQRLKNKFYDEFGSTNVSENFQIQYYFNKQNYIIFSSRGNQHFEIALEPSEFYKSFSTEEIHTLVNEAKNYRQDKTTLGKAIFRQSYDNLQTHIDTLLDDHSIYAYIPAGRIIAMLPRLSDYYLYAISQQEMSNSNGVPVPSIDSRLIKEYLRKAEDIKDIFDSTDFAGLIDAEVLRGESVNRPVLEIVVEHIERILRGRYSQEGESEQIYLSNTNTAINLQNASTGQQDAIRVLQDIFLILLHKQNAFRVIEEPEVHLYPMSQKHLIEIFAIMLNNTNSQLVVSTHSPYILSIANN